VAGDFDEDRIGDVSGIFNEAPESRFDRRELFNLAAETL
jgi:hypothetical protein